MKRYLPLLIILTTSLLLPPTSSSQAQSGVEVVSQEVEYTFAEQINFRLVLDSLEDVSGINLVLQASGFPSFVGEMQLSTSGRAQFVYDLTQRPLPAFSFLTYSYRITLKDGEIIDTPSASFTYLDNRYNWQELIQEPYRIYWYEGEITLAQEVLDVAVQAQNQVLDLLQQPKTDQTVTIFIYTSEEELQSTLTSLGQSWVGGHADPALGSVVVALPAAVDQPLEIQRLIPHELTHILLYRFMGAEYDYLPAWFNEGLASTMEFYSLPEYDLILDKAYQEGELIPIPHLCEAFPTDADLALLSYAQSNSLVDYIRDEFGVSGIQAMINAYDQGVSCDQGVESALGKNLASLEKGWKLDTFEKRKYITYIYILGGILLVLVISLSGFIFFKLKEPLEMELEPEEQELYEEEFEIPPPR